MLGFLQKKIKVFWGPADKEHWPLLKPKKQAKMMKNILKITLRNPYKLLKPPGRRGQKKSFLSLRNPYKLLKLLRNFTPPPPPPPALRHKRGMGLAEVLVAGAVGGVIIAGSMKSLQLSLQSAQVVKSSLSESDLHHTIRQVLSSKQDCLSNFKPTGETIPSDPKQPSSIGLYGADREWGVGEVVRFAKTFGNTDNTDDEALLKKGVAFKGDLSIVKMELKGQPPRPKDSTTKLDKKPALRTFVVYYKKEGMGGYSTLGGEPCDKDNLQGCYFNQCKVELRLDDSATAGTNEAKCEGMCADYRSGGGGGSGNPDCYKVDKEAGKERTLVGCGADEAEGAKTTAIGFNAGKDLTGGSDNIAIGHSVQLASPTGSNQINIGNIIQANRDTDPDDTTKKMGVLKICNPGGTDGDGKCIELSKKSLACPENHYFRGIKEDGTPECQEEEFCPQSQHHWTPENICHECPRDSPLYRANADPPDCVSCASNSIYILTGTNKNTCQVCPTDQIPVDGVCQCRNNKVLSNGHCCPTSHPFYHTGGCRLCPTNRQRKNQQTGQCECNDFWPHEYDGGCHGCPKNQVYIGKQGFVNICCPANKPLYEYSEQRCTQCPRGPYNEIQVYDNGHCCPTTTPYYYNEQCNRCRSEQVAYGNQCCNRPYSYNDRCNLCLETQVESNGHCCPSDLPHHYEGKCNKCRSDQILSNGHCCPNTKPYYHSGGCRECPTGRFSYRANGGCTCREWWPHEYDGDCHECPKSKLFINRLNTGIVCCPPDKPNYDYIERLCNNCRSDQILSNGHCCPLSNRYYYDGKCNLCREDQYLYNGGCLCPAKQQTIVNDRCQCPNSRWVPAWYPKTNEKQSVCDCPHNEAFVNGSCQCPEGGYRDSNGDCRCPGNQRAFVWSNPQRYKCICLFGAWNGSTCGSCRGSQAQHNNTCVDTCPSGTTRMVVAGSLQCVRAD